jgi:hypothetical protein
MKIIKVRVAKDGDTKLEAEGFSGEECTRATAAMEAAIGGTGIKELKPEFYSPDPANTITQN